MCTPHVLVETHEVGASVRAFLGCESATKKRCAWRASRAGMPYRVLRALARPGATAGERAGPYMAARVAARRWMLTCAERTRVRCAPRIAAIGLRLFLQMVLVDNFTHADLHPGNMLVRFVRPDGSAVAAPEEIGALARLAPLPSSPDEEHRPVPTRSGA